MSNPQFPVPLGMEFFDLILDGVRKHLEMSTLRAHFDGLEETPIEDCGSRINTRPPLLEKERALAQQIKPANSTGTPCLVRAPDGIGEEIA